MKKINPWLLALIIIVLMAIFAPLFGKVVTIAGGGDGSNWIGTSEQWSYISGFFLGYAFFIPLLFTIFGRKRKNLVIIISVITEFLFFWGSWNAIIINFITAFIGWLLGEAILRVVKISK